MPAVTPALALIIFVAGIVSGGLGALLGLGGGIFLVPFLNLALKFPFQAAAAISLTTVIATSSSVSAGRAGKQLINIRLGMLLLRCGRCPRHALHPLRIGGWPIALGDQRVG